MGKFEHFFLTASHFEYNIRSYIVVRVVFWDEDRGPLELAALSPVIGDYVLSIKDLTVVAGGSFF